MVDLDRTTVKAEDADRDPSERARIRPVEPDHLAHEAIVPPPPAAGRTAAVRLHALGELRV